MIKHLEDVLRHLASGNQVPPGSCCACLQYVDTRRHLPNCIIHLALIEIEEWRELGGKTLGINGNSFNLLGAMLSAALGASY
jgi:hypothetical protein